MGALAKTYGEQEQRMAVADALRSLTTSGLRVPVVREDLPAMVETWLDQLRDVAPEVIRDVGRLMAGEAEAFPTLAQFRAAAAVTGRRVNMTLAQECGCGGTTWVAVEVPEVGPAVMESCPVCVPDRYEWERGGHSRPGHNRDSCQHPMCQPTHTTTRRGR